MARLHHRLAWLHRQCRVGLSDIRNLGTRASQGEIGSKLSKHSNETNTVANSAKDVGLAYSRPSEHSFAITLNCLFAQLRVEHILFGFGYYEGNL